MANEETTVHVRRYTREEKDGAETEKKEWRKKNAHIYGKRVKNYRRVVFADIKVHAARIG